MAQFIIDLDDDLAVYLQESATRQGMPIGEYLSEMIVEDLQLGAEIDRALEIAGVDTEGCDAPPILAAVSMLVSSIKYHADNERAWKKDALPLSALRKIDARRGNRSREGFILSLLDHEEAP